MPSKKTRKIASTQSDFSKSLGEKQMRANSFLSLKMVFEDTIVRINSFIDSMFIIEMFNERSYVIGFKNSLVVNIPNFETETELQKAEIKLVTYVVVYFAHILVSLSKLAEPFTDEELEYIMEKIDAFMELTNINFLQPLPADMKPTCMRGIKNTLDTIFNINEFQISGLSQVDIGTLQTYNGYPLIKIIESINDAYAIKRAEILYKIAKINEEKQNMELKKQAELAEAKAMAEKAEAELLASLSASNKKKPNKTQKNKAPAKATVTTPAKATVTTPEKATVTTPIAKSLLSEKELKKIEADEKNRLRQLEEKQKREEEQRKRNEEIMKKFTIQSVEKSSPEVLPEPKVSPKSKVSPVHNIVAPEPEVVPAPIVSPVHNANAPLQKTLINYFSQEQLKQLRAYIMTGKAAKQIEAEFPNMHFTETADDAYKMIVRSTLFVLSELTKATGYPIFCLKGGKIPQLTEPIPYISDDIDILVLNSSHKTASEIANFVTSMFVGLPISVLDKSLIATSLPKANQNIIKISYGKTSFKAFLDIDFSPTPTYSQMFFANLYPIPFGSLLFYAQSHIQFVDEKIFFNEIYTEKCKQQRDTYKQNICKYIISKFQRILNTLISSPIFYKERVTILQPYIDKALLEFEL